MPSQLHEALLLLFRNQPALAAKLIRGALDVELPQFREAREVGADLSNVQPVEYRADMVIGLDDDRTDLYVELITNSLSGAARRALMDMNLRSYEFQSELALDWARRKFARERAESEAEGELRGRAALVIRLLTVKFGKLAPQVHDRIQRASIEELDAIGERLLTAPTLQEALGPE